jgi:hypothetical protein
VKTLLLHDSSSDRPFAAALEAAGHEVVRCTRLGRVAFPCDGLEGNCPLDGTVDLAVVVHDRPTGDISPGEAGVVCALRDGLPLVVAGNGARHPFGDKVAAVAASVEDVTSACQRAVAARNARLARLAGTPVAVEGGRVRATLPAGSSSADVLRAHRRLSEALPRAHAVDVRIG